MNAFGLPTFQQQRRAHLVKAASDVFAERGFAGVTMTDLADAIGVSRSTLYSHARGVHDVLVLVVEELVATELSLVAGERTDEILLPLSLARRLVQRHQRVGAVELVARGVAASGVPRLRTALAHVDLGRHHEAVAILRALTGIADHRVHLIELLLRPDAYGHLVDHCGWSPLQAQDWLTQELSRLAQRTRLAWREEQERLRAKTSSLAG